MEKTCGSAPIQTATSRRWAPTRRAAASTGTTTAGVSCATGEKFDRVLEFGRTLPKIRAVVDRHLGGRGMLSRERVLAAAIRLIDLGFFRPGGDEYAAENGSYGLATIRREHVTCSKSGEITFDYIGKRAASSRNRPSSTPTLFSVVRSLKLRRSRPDLEDLLGYRSGQTLA